MSWKKFKNFAVGGLPFVWSTAAAAAGDIYSAREQRKAEREANASNERAVAATNEANARIAQQNIDLQREFARNGLRWKMDDALAAGVHPMYAMGASGSSFSPVSQPVETSFRTPSSARSNLMSNLGQNISRSVRATQTSEERLRDRLTTERLGLENELLRTQIADGQRNQVGPPFPSNGNFAGITGQGDIVVNKPLLRTISQPGRPAQEAGWRPDVSYSRTDTGLTPMIPESLSESLEDDLIGKIMWRIRNQGFPNVSFGNIGKPARSQLPRGATDWRWSFFKQEWQPARSKSVPWYRRKFK